jgi:hypothetical protein
VRLLVCQVHERQPELKCLDLKIRAAPVHMQVTFTQVQVKGVKKAKVEIKLKEEAL